LAISFTFAQKMISLTVSHKSFNEISQYLNIFHTGSPNCYIKS